MDGDTFQCIQMCPSPFHSNLVRIIIHCCEWLATAQLTSYFPSQGWYPIQVTWGGWSGANESRVSRPRAQHAIVLGPMQIWFWDLLNHRRALYQWATVPPNSPDACVSSCWEGLNPIFYIHPMVILRTWNNGKKSSTMNLILFVCLFFKIYTMSHELILDNANGL